MRQQRHNLSRTFLSRAFRTAFICSIARFHKAINGDFHEAVSKLVVSVQFIKQRLGLFQIERIEAFGEPLAVCTVEATRTFAVIGTRRSGGQLRAGFSAKIVPWRSGHGRAPI